MDNQGREIQGRGSAGRIPDYVFGLDIPADAKSVDLTFAITRRVSVEFLAKPSRMTSNELDHLRKALGYQ